MKALLRRVVVLIAIVFVVYILLFVRSRTTAPERVLSNRTISTPAATRTDKEIKVGTWNIAHGRGGAYGASNWTGKSREQLEEHLEKIGTQIRRANVDIMALNEADFDCTWSRNLDQAELIAREAKFPYLATQRNVDVSVPFYRMAFGNAVLSRFPIEEIRHVDFPSHSKFENAIAGDHDGLLCTIRTPLGVVRVLAVHLEHRSEKARVEAARIIDSISREGDTPMIVAGDLNSTPKGFNRHQVTGDDENAVELLLHGGWFQTRAPGVPAPEDLTFPSEQPDRMIDWILSTQQLEQRLDWKCHASDLSDHRMISVCIAPARPWIEVDESKFQATEIIPQSAREAVEQADSFVAQLPYGIPRPMSVGVVETDNYYVVLYPMLVPKKIFKPDVLTEVRIPKKHGVVHEVVVEGMTRAQLAEKTSQQKTP